MPQAPSPRRACRAPALLVAILAVLLLGALSACGGDEEDAGQTPTEAMEQAKKNFDESSSVHLALSTKSTPTAGNGVLGANGTVTRAPAFKGDVKVLLSGITATVPVTSVDGKVFAKLPLTTRYAEINPAEYGAPDPADFGDPDTGLSALLTQMEDLEEGDSTRRGDLVLTSYTGTVPGAAVKEVIPSADAEQSYETTVGLDEDGFARTVRVTGTFFSGSDDVTYDVEFDRYGEDVEITAPRA